MSQPGKLSYVIAISGPSGAGKSKLIQELTSRLVDAAALRIDDYETTSTYPDTTRWLAEGADPNLFYTPQFSADLRALRSGTVVVRPDSQVALQPARFLLVEEPFGRARAEMRDLIDFVVCVEIPLEIALARKILRPNAFLPWEDDPGLFITHLRELLSWYLSAGRSFYLAINQIVLKDCDLVIDGTRPSAELAESILTAVRVHQQSS